MQERVIFCNWTGLGWICARKALEPWHHMSSASSPTCFRAPLAESTCSSGCSSNRSYSRRAEPQ